MVAELSTLVFAAFLQQALDQIKFGGCLAQQGVDTVEGLHGL